MPTLYAVAHVLLLGIDTDVLLPVGGLVIGPVTLLAVVAVGAALAWVTVRDRRSRPCADNDVRTRCGAMLRRSERRVLLAFRDPDAPGRARPRAPATAPAAG
ncbi:DUF6412 domain-containing protein [Marinitenerispora sediminis]|uniref:Uncharacterized protein n=1 Tax=Marinitenerispora sediminis TaxID=1931232 RepID=A0A368SZC6_9ACTN|nr:DUF6412 domain-containing protein [Marinitenerispora sediminis]RCV48873.1 hypothetical protein DEF23_24355 [Marinitenerispora sediminis]RCV50845.1 hypothetical protein DEF24_23775 [Marinitenerispora sediminis]RCV57291.1 hypothetical protein DEF28_02060 [Marinitenerispora sediminis]